MITKEQRVLISLCIIAFGIYVIFFARGIGESKPVPGLVMQTEVK